MNTKLLEIAEKVRAIVMFGPPADHSGMRPAEYYQVTLDPQMVSPSGEFIRFDQTIQGGEMHGWQRIQCTTVCEVLGEGAEYDPPEGCKVDPDAVLTMLMVDHG
jgi:hypothetical protein